MEKKYELTEETLAVDGHVLHRIKALLDFGNVKKGDIGGWIESEYNLLHDDDCWVYGDAKVYGNAKVYGYAKVYGNAIVCGNAIVLGNAKVYGDAEVYGKAIVYGNAIVHGYAKVYGDAIVYGDAEVYGNAEVYGKAIVYGDAIVEKKSDYIVFKNWWSSGRYFTWTRSNDRWTVGCFYGTGEELIKKAYADSEEKGREYERVVKYVESIKSEIDK